MCTWKVQESVVKLLGASHHRNEDSSSYMSYNLTKILETLYFILAWMACPWSCACDPPPSLISCRQSKIMLKTWWNNFKWRGGGRWVLYIADMWLAVVLVKKAGFCQSVSIFLQLVVDMTLLHPISNPSRKNTYIDIYISCHKQEAAWLSG